MAYVTLLDFIERGVDTGVIIKGWNFLTYFEFLKFFVVNKIKQKIKNKIRVGLELKSSFSKAHFQKL